MTRKDKPATAGEKIVMNTDLYPTPSSWSKDGEDAQYRCARRIDSAIKRAVKNDRLATARWIMDLIESDMDPQATDTLKYVHRRILGFSK